MPNSPDAHKEENTYVIDTESGAEIARLIHQARLVTRSMGGVFSQQMALSHVHDVLDIGCGPGGWVLDVAYTHPDMHVVGTDISESMIEYARTTAKVQGRQNAQFRVMNFLEPLDFPNASFDFVNSRFTTFITRTAWSSLLQECLRILRPGGMIRFTTSDNFGMTNSVALETFNDLFAKAAKLAGYGFSPHAHSIGITPMLARFLLDAGFQNIQHEVNALNYSIGMADYEPWHLDVVTSLKLVQPYFIRLGLSSQEEIDQLYEQFLVESASDDFCGLWYILSAWGEKPS